MLNIDYLKYYYHTFNQSCSITCFAPLYNTCLYWFTNANGDVCSMVFCGGGLALTVKRWVWCDVWCVVCVVNTKQGGCGRCCLNN